MRLFTMQLAPNSWRTVMFVREKCLAIPFINVDLATAEQKSAFRAVSPLGQVPVLELDDGSYICESLTICQYLDAISDSPRLFGQSLEERTRIAMCLRFGARGRRQCSVRAGNDHGPNIPCFPAIALARKLLRGKLTTWAQWRAWGRSV